MIASRYRYPRRVTISGADDRASVNRMLELSANYPVDLGILLGENLGAPGGIAKPGDRMAASDAHADGLPVSVRPNV